MKDTTIRFTAFREGFDMYFLIAARRSDGMIKAYAVRSGWVQEYDASTPVPDFRLMYPCHVLKVPPIVRALIRANFDRDMQLWQFKCP